MIPQKKQLSQHGSDNNIAHGLQEGMDTCWAPHPKLEQLVSSVEGKISAVCDTVPDNSFGTKRTRASLKAKEFGQQNANLDS